jgi:hypothetical protein
MQDLHVVTMEPSMARPSRAERRRMTARDAAAVQPKHAAPVVDMRVDSNVDVYNADAQSEPTRLVRTTRRVLRVPEQVDYTGEYRMISHDLRRIAFWGMLLIVVMFSIRYSGLV